MGKAILLSCVLIILSGCERNANNEIDPSNLMYFKDRYGICYATVANYSYGVSIVRSITTVDCKKVNL